MKTQIGLILIDRRTNCQQASNLENCIEYRHVGGQLARFYPRAFYIIYILTQTTATYENLSEKLQLTERSNESSNNILNFVLI